MVAMAVALLLAAGAAPLNAADKSVDADAGVQSMVQEESPEVFLAKATLQQYLSRVVRKDWDGARRLTHSKTLAAIADMKRRTGEERHNLAPWANQEDQLKTFRFGDARQVGPGAVAIAVGEDTWHAEEKGMSADDPAVYLLFRSHGGFVVGDKKANSELSDISDESVRIGYRGYVDNEGMAQARRTPTHGRHR